MSSTTAQRPAAFRPLSVILQDAALVGFCVLSAIAHLSQLADGHLLSSAFLAEQILLAVLFLVRRRPAVTSSRPFDWIVAIGSWLPIAMRPAESSVSALLVAGACVQFVGLALTIVGFLYLGRSFGIVAANRGLKVNGPYRVVRHPIYFSHGLTQVGFLLANPSWLNLAIFALVSLCQVFRMSAEERILTESADYALYQKRVRWRVLPGLY
ncbi:MAG: methyltransferase family protein [Hyphomicrobiales bacterium]